MKLTRSIDIGWAIIMLSILFRLLETWYFGWNTMPINDYELWADRLSELGLGAGIYFLFHPAFMIYYAMARRIDDK